MLHAADQVLLHGHFTHLLKQIVWDRGAGWSGALSWSSGLLDLLAADATHLADLLHRLTQILHHVVLHIKIPPKMS